MEQHSNHPPENLPPTKLPPPPITLGMGTMKDSDERVWGLATHLSALVLPIIGALIVYLVNKELSPFVTKHAKDNLNFQLSYLIWSTICVATCWLIIPVFLAFALAIIFLVFTIISAIKAHDGKFGALPLTLPLIK